MKYLKILIVIICVFSFMSIGHAEEESFVEQCFRYCNDIYPAQQRWFYGYRPNLDEITNCINETAIYVEGFIQLYKEAAAEDKFPYENCAVSNTFSKRPAGKSVNIFGVFECLKNPAYVFSVPTRGKYK